MSTPNDSVSASPRPPSPSSKGFEKKSTGYVARPLQLELHKKLKRFSVLVMHRRFGKCLDVNTPIPTPDQGYVRMGDLRAGDYVFDETGTPTLVVAAHPVLRNLKCYEVQFSDGSRVICDEEHLWFTQTKLDRTARDRSLSAQSRSGKSHGHLDPRPGSVKTTRQILESLTHMGEANHRIPTCGPLQYPEQALPIDPYVLGLWLGDGTSRAPHFTSMDAEIVTALQEYADLQGYELHPTKHQNAGRAKTYALIGGFQVALRALEVLGNKHIPDIYLRSSIAQRQEILQGLMDTDGSITPSGHCEFSNKNVQIIESVETLLSSFGIKHTRISKQVNGRTYHRVTFSPSFCCFKLTRKALRHRVIDSPRGYRYITGMIEVESRPVRCIEVDSPSHLFLCTKDNIPTHNTVFAINEMIARGLRCKHPNPRCAYLAPLYGQAKRVAWDYLKQYTANLPGATPNEADLRIDVPRPDRGDSVRFTLLGADNPASLKGIYLDCVILDEYADMNPTVWGEVIRPTLSDRDGRAIFIGTPKGRNAFHELFLRSTEGFQGEDGSRAQNKEWFGALFKASETGIISQSELESAKREMSEDEYEQEFECSFNAGLTGAYFAKEMTLVEKEGRILDVPYDPALPVVTFWDLGVNDTTCIGFFQRYGSQWRCIDYHEECGQGIPHYIKILKLKPYVYEALQLPHDARARDLSTGKSREEVFRNYGYRTKILPKLDIADGISAIRLILPRVVFDRKKTERLRECLINYQRRWNAKNLVFENNPLHNQYSNGADMFRYFSLGAQEDRGFDARNLPRTADHQYNPFGD